MAYRTENIVGILFVQKPAFHVQSALLCIHVSALYSVCDGHVEQHIMYQICVMT